MKIELNFIEGYFGVEASLAPSSYLLVPQCHLTGGFALYYWFEPNPASGDWVFTLGGYHPQFIPPPYYPKAKRIGISFQLGGNINVTGETYFAMCPKAVMGGGRLHLDVSIPLISAYLDAYADFLIMYKPLHYIADIGVDVGVVSSILPSKVSPSPYSMLTVCSHSMRISGSLRFISPPILVRISISRDRPLVVSHTLISGLLLPIFSKHLKLTLRSQDARIRHRVRFSAVAPTSTYP